VYEGLWLPCVFCLTHNIDTPCVKLKGPKFELARTIPRLVSTPIDAAIDPNDFWLLEATWRLRWSSKVPRGLYMCIPTIFGKTLPSQALRNAILAFTVRRHRLSSTLPFQEKYYRHNRLACWSLRQKMNNPESVEESDLVAVWFLLCSAMEQRDWNETGVHLLGFISIIEVLRTPARNTAMMPFVHGFGPTLYTFTRLLLKGLVHLRTMIPCSNSVLRRESLLEEVRRVTDFKLLEGPLPFPRFVNFAGVVYEIATAECHGILEPIDRAREDGRKACADWEHWKTRLPSDSERCVSANIWT
jgi:hypothetical protein